MTLVVAKQTDKTTTRASKRGFKRYEINPSVPLHLDATSKCKKIGGVKGNYMVIADTDKGEVTAEAKPAGFYTVDFVDREKFVKLFISGVKAFAGLTSAGIKVFEVLYREVQDNANVDKVTISYELASKSIKMSRKTFFNGMRELLLKGFIYESLVPYQYFININYIFNGNRLAFVKEYHLKEKATTNGDQPTLPGFEEHLSKATVPALEGGQQEKESPALCATPLVLASPAANGQ